VIAFKYFLTVILNLKIDISWNKTNMIQFSRRLNQNEIGIGPRRASYAFQMNLQVLVSWEFNLKFQNILSFLLLSPADCLRE